MAEQNLTVTEDPNEGSDLHSNEGSNENSNMCPICCESPKTPIYLVCHHTFCYLCIKTNMTYGSFTCPICRADVPEDVFEEATADINNLSVENKGYAWMYEGRTGGWWYYQGDHNDLIEKAWEQYNAGGSKQFLIDICSVSYVINFSELKQRKINGFACRNIKRETSIRLESAKGIAGVRYISNTDQATDVQYI